MINDTAFKKGGNETGTWYSRVGVNGHPDEFPRTWMKGLDGRSTRYECPLIRAVGSSPRLNTRVYRVLVNTGANGVREGRKMYGRVLPLKTKMPLGKFVRPLWPSFGRSRSDITVPLPFICHSSIHRIDRNLLLFQLRSPFSWLVSCYFFVRWIFIDQTPHCGIL